MPDWSAKSSRFTERFESHAIDILLSTAMTNASRILGISWDQAWNIMDRSVKRGFAGKTLTPEKTGIDEESYRKHHHYITIIYDLVHPAVDHVEFDGKLVCFLATGS